MASRSQFFKFMWDWVLTLIQVVECKYYSSISRSITDPSRKDFVSAEFPSIFLSPAPAVEVIESVLCVYVCESNIVHHHNGTRLLCTTGLHCAPPTPRIPTAHTLLQRCSQSSCPCVCLWVRTCTWHQWVTSVGRKDYERCVNAGAFSLNLFSNAPPLQKATFFQKTTALSMGIARSKCI